MAEKETALQKYELKPEDVAKQAKEFMNLVVLPDDKESYNEAKKAKGILVKIRTGTDKRRKELNDDYQKRIKDNNAAAKMLTDAAAPAEAHVKAEIQKEDDRKEAILEEKRQKEIERINTIQGKVVAIQKYSESLTGLHSDAIQDILTVVHDIEISLEEYQEFAQAAKLAKEEVVKILGVAFDAALKQEQEDAARKAENERLEKIRIEQEAEAARLKKIEEEQEAKRRAEQEKIEKEKAAIQAEKDRIAAEKKREQDRKDREAFEAQAREEARIKAEKEAKEKAEREEQERIAKEKAEAEEIERQKQLLPDKQKLLSYAEALKQVDLPNVNSEEAQRILTNAYASVMEVADIIIDSVESL